MASSHAVSGFRFEDDTEYAAYQEQKRLLNEEAREHFGDPDWIAEQAEIITETMYLGFEAENVLQLMSTLQRNVGKFDRVTVREARGLRAFFVAQGGYIRASQMWADVVDLPRVMVGFHVYDETDKFEANFAETQGDLIDNGIKRMDATVNQYLFALFQAAVPSGSAGYASASGLSLTTLDTFLSQAFDVSEDDQVFIAGRRPMIDQISTKLLNLPSSQSVFIPETNERLMQVGVLGKYRGANIVQIKNYRDDLEIPFLPANELWIGSRDNSTSAFFGPFESKEYEEDDNWIWHFLARRRLGAMVHKPWRLRRIVDTNISATQGATQSYVAA